MGKLTREQRENLAFIMARLTLKYKQDKNVECIYLTPFEDGGEIIYDFVVLFNNVDSAKKFRQEAREYNKKYGEEKIKERYGGHVRRYADLASCYEERALNPSRVNRVRDLLSSRILYAKKGYGRHYCRVAHQFDKYHTMDKYNNIVNLRLPKNKVKTKTKKED